MPTPAVSYTLLSFVESRLLDTDTGFNALINETAGTYSVDPFQLSSDGTSPNRLYVGRFDIPALTQAGAGQVNYPCAILSVARSDASGNKAMRVTPSTFSGQIVISLDFYVNYPQGGIPTSDGLFHAIEDAVVSTFASPDSYSLTPGGVAYNNEITIDQGLMAWNNTYWLQMIPCALFFDLIV